VIFEEKTTHLAKQPIPTVFLEENNLFPLKPAQIINKAIEPASKNTKTCSPQLGIVPRPLTIQELHYDNVLSPVEIPTQEQTQNKVPNLDKKLPITIYRTR